MSGLYTAPAGKVLTVVHIRAATQPETTVCGQPMDGDWWLDVEPQPGERICPACQQPGSGPAQGALL